MLAIKTNVVLRQGTYHMGNSWEKTEKEAGEGKGGWEGDLRREEMLYYFFNWA